MNTERIIRLASKAATNYSGLADLLGVSRSLVSSWLKEKSQPSEDDLVRMIRLAAKVDPLVREDAIRYYEGRYKKILENLRKPWKEETADEQG